MRRPLSKFIIQLKIAQQKKVVNAKKRASYLKQFSTPKQILVKLWLFEEQRFPAVFTKISIFKKISTLRISVFYI